MEYKRCSSCIPGSGALTGYYQPGQLIPGFLIKGPFYIYQVFIVIIWSVQLYVEFAVCIVLLSVISQSKALRDAVHSHSVVTILRDGQEEQLSSAELVPGDILVLESGDATLECDAVLLEGSCVVNESMLTGESIPITKTALTTMSTERYSFNVHKRNTLYCGTTVLHSRSVDSPKAKAVVIRTGYATAKGELVRAILFPRPIDFKLYSDLYKSMICFLFLAFTEFSTNLLLLSYSSNSSEVLSVTDILEANGLPDISVHKPAIGDLQGYRVQARALDIAIIVLDVATFVVPPVLPAVLTSINAHGQLRLRRQAIFCLNTRYINFCGGLDVVCFDKVLSFFPTYSTLKIEYFEIS
ncbi:hypothetical protein LAZ67_X000235 [Cordylochernes scorpioides]|uniref:P-type ATPase A domain-containing protein n=1 Tax=Cordylochernes scorpioides TaxID=51811 RepID=A0ABY6LVP8_9ARAC|nr:hypothetical protein LAZ67_X000235 [Cordylochernes scorpioides]